MVFEGWIESKGRAIMEVGKVKYKEGRIGEEKVGKIIISTGIILTVDPCLDDLLLSSTINYLNYLSYTFLFSSILFNFRSYWSYKNEG